MGLKGLVPHNNTNTDFRYRLHHLTLDPVTPECSIGALSLLHHMRPTLELGSQCTHLRERKGLVLGIP